MCDEHPYNYNPITASPTYRSQRFVRMGVIFSCDSCASQNPLSAATDHPIQPGEEVMLKEKVKVYEDRVADLEEKLVSAMVHSEQLQEDHKMIQNENESLLEQVTSMKQLIDKTSQENSIKTLKLEERLKSLEAEIAIKSSSESAMIKTLQERLQNELDFSSVLKIQLEDLSKTEMKTDKQIKEVNIKEVNAYLKLFANEKTFQDELKKPTVRTALSFWSGSPTQSLDDKETEEIKNCPGVLYVYPRLKQLEEICIKYGIKYPLDHIVKGKENLSQEALIESFGSNFVLIA